MARPSLTSKIAVLLNATANDAPESCLCLPCLNKAQHYAAVGWECKICGHIGVPIIQRCECLDQFCTGYADYVPGSGCVHGMPLCPVCENGEHDGWDLVRAVRQALG